MVGGVARAAPSWTAAEGCVLTVTVRSLTAQKVTVLCVILCFKLFVSSLFYQVSCDVTCAFSNGLAEIPRTRCDELGGLTIEDNNLDSESDDLFTTRRVLVGHFIWTVLRSFTNCSRRGSVSSSPLSPASTTRYAARAPEKRARSRSLRATETGPGCR